jgi:tRNA-2-methylthio-N6-dimethylallyladenosine synthase
MYVYAMFWDEKEPALPATSTKRVFVITYGCQMNVFDTRRILQVLGHAGFEKTEDPTNCDLFLINTCSVREKPEARVFSTLARFKPLKDLNPDMIFAVCGCVAQQHGRALLEKVPWLDLVFGPDNIKDLPSLLTEVYSGKRVALTERMPRSSYEFVEVEEEFEKGPTAFLTIMKGCDKVCTFCIVPYVRGREVSKPFATVMKEVKALVASGVKEITLLGQNVNSYGKGLQGNPDFVGLLEALNEVQGLERLRFITSHPKDADQRMMACFKNLEKVCEYLHLPAQSGSNRILKLMKRGYTSEEFIEKVEMARHYCPDIALSTDIIVGFPGETVEDFEDTLRLLERVQFDTIFSFKYSPRPHTVASRFKDDCPPQEKQRRLEVLQALQNEITRKRMQRFLSRIEEVLVEGPSERNPFQLCGRTRTNFVVNFNPVDGVQPGSLVRVRITEVLTNSLRGEIVGHRGNIISIPRAEEAHGY